MKIISGSSLRHLSEKICERLGTTLVNADVKRFSDSEVFVEVKENIRGQDVFIIQSTSKPANDNIMELLIMADAIKRASAKRITAVIPYYGYARQDRKVAPRAPISAKLVANILTSAGIDRVLTLDLHAGQIQGFFDIPVDNLYAAPLIIKDIRNNPSIDKGNAVIVSPDVGGLVRARAVASKLNCDLAIVDKRRPKAGVSEVMNIIGDVSGKDCIMIDDIVDSGGTLCNAAAALIERGGANKVFSYVTHGVLSGEAVDRISKSKLSQLVITNTIEQPQDVLESKNIRILDVSDLFAEAVNNISLEKSLSVLFN